MERNARMRMITEKGVREIIDNPPAKYFPATLCPKLKYVNYKLVSYFPAVELVIFDKKKMFVSTQKEKQIKDMTWFVLE